MTRAELLLQLADLVARRAITEAQAARLLALFDEGDLTPADLPSMAEPESNRNDWLLALALLLLLTRGNTSAKLSAAKRSFARNTLRRNFEGEMHQLAAGINSGKIPLQSWQEEMQAAISRYTRQMAVAGAGTLPVAPVQSIVEAQLAEQWPFLRGFALTLAAKGLVAGGAAAEQAGLSIAKVASRSKLYGGVGWSAFWSAAAAAATGDGATGWIVHFRARDDRGTCSPCSNAARSGPYAADGAYPLPGASLCQGAGNCRCELQFEYAPDVYNRLTGRRAA